MRKLVGALVIAVTACGGSAPPTATPPAPTPSASPSASAPATSSVPSASADITGDWDVRWDRGFAGWKPTIFEGKLSLHRTADAWSGDLSFNQSVARLTFQSAHVEGDRFDLHFQAESLEGKDDLEIWGVAHEDRLVGEARWGKVIAWTPFGGHRHGSGAPPTSSTSDRLEPRAVDHSLPAFDIASAGLDRAELQRLVENAAEERSSAVVIAVDGKIGLEVYRDGYDGSPIAAMSASKSITSMAVGMLVAEGKLSLDTRMGALFPEWRKQGAKAAITVRHLLTQTSGLEPSRADFEHETIREHALAAKVLWPPGSRFQYNNGGVDFLAVVVSQVAGVTLDEYLQTHLFQKMQILGASWMKDSEGTPRAAGELIIRPVDLAKLGQLMLDGGVWQGTRLLPADWVKQSVAAGQPYDESYGLLWWREGKFAFVMTEPVLASWKDAGVDAKTLLPVRALIGHKYDWSGYREALEKALGADGMKSIQATIEKGDHVPFAGKTQDGPIRGFSARGWLGQYVVVLPAPRVVAVRMRAWEPSDEHAAEEKDGYRGFARDVAKLFRAVD